MTKARIFARPDMLNSAAIGAKLGLGRGTVNARRNAGTLFALTHGGRIRYPAWQLEGGALAAIPVVLRILKGNEPWAVYLFLTQGNPLLDGKSPLAVLQAGEDASVIYEAARAHAAETA